MVGWEWFAGVMGEIWQGRAGQGRVVPQFWRQSSSWQDSGESPVPQQSWPGGAPGHTGARHTDPGARHIKPGARTVPRPRCRGAPPVPQPSLCRALDQGEVSGKHIIKPYLQLLV